MDAAACMPTTIAGAPPRKRRRPALSCAECRRRKVKCDRNIPCRQCTQAKSATCTYSPERLSSVNSHGNRAVGPLETPHGTPTSPNGPPRATDISFLEEGQGEGIVAATPTSSSGSEQSTVQTLVDRVQRLEHALASASLDARASSAGCRTKTSAKKEIDRSVWHKTRFYGQSHWVHPFEQVCPSETLNSTSIPDLTSD